jgi:hypothetical protein
LPREGKAAQEPCRRAEKTKTSGGQNPSTLSGGNLRRGQRARKKKLGRPKQRAAAESSLLQEKESASARFWRADRKPVWENQIEQEDKNHRAKNEMGEQIKDE